MTFDPSISIGTIINALALLIGGIYVASTIRADLRWLSMRLEKVEVATDRLETAFSTLAVQEDRLNAFARRLERLEAKYIERE